MGSRKSERKRRKPIDVWSRENVSPEKEISIAKPQLDGLPTEVLEIVFRLLPYHVIAGTVRLVSRRCAAVATSVLNNAFLVAGNRLKSAMQRSNDLQSSTNEAHERGLQIRAHDCLELALAQYELLRACCSRYTHPIVNDDNNTDFGSICFYGGLILDEIDTLIRKAKYTPASLMGRLGPETAIGNLDSTCKAFMNHFEHVTEVKLNRNSLVSGCKLVDILDCLITGRKLVSCKITDQHNQQRRSHKIDRKITTTGGGKLVTMKSRYVLKRSWFTSLDLPDSDEHNDSWSDQQRFMYLRLRRLVGVVNEHHLSLLHHKRFKVSARASQLIPRPSSLTWSLYSGYGDCGGRFYYYGNMNESAFDNKVIMLWRRNSSRDRRWKWRAAKKPNYDLVINVQLKCSPELAPLAARSMLELDNLDDSTIISSERPQIYLKLSFTCPASISNRLPSNFVWEVKEPQR